MCVWRCGERVAPLRPRLLTWIYRRVWVSRGYHSSCEELTLAHSSLFVWIEFDGSCIVTHGARTGQYLGSYTDGQGGVSIRIQTSVWINRGLCGDRRLRKRNQTLRGKNNRQQIHQVS